MKYYEIYDCEHAVKNPMICMSNLESLRIQEEAFKTCEMHNSLASKPIKFYVRDEEDEGCPDDVLQNTDMIPVYSPRLINALNEAGIKGIQYLPVDVLNYKKELINGFCIANVIDSVSNALIIEKSLCQYYPEDYDDIAKRNKIWFIWRYAIDYNAVKGHDIFRLKYDNRFTMPYSKLLVSEKFKSIFTKNKFTGYSFGEIIVE